MANVYGIEAACRAIVKVRASFIIHVHDVQLICVLQWDSKSFTERSSKRSLHEAHLREVVIFKPTEVIDKTVSQNPTYYLFFISYQNYEFVINYGKQVIRHLLRRQLLLWWYLQQQRVRVKVMIGFLVQVRVRIKIGIRVRIGVMF